VIKFSLRLLAFGERPNSKNYVEIRGDLNLCFVSSSVNFKIKLQLLLLLLLLLITFYEIY
jgi:hypothetical protein